MLYVTPDDQRSWHALKTWTPILNLSLEQKDTHKTESKEKLFTFRFAVLIKLSI